MKKQASDQAFHDRRYQERKREEAERKVPKKKVAKQSSESRAPSTEQVRLRRGLPLQGCGSAGREQIPSASSGQTLTSFGMTIS